MTPLVVAADVVRVTAGQVEHMCGAGLCELCQVFTASGVQVPMTGGGTALYCAACVAELPALLGDAATELI